MPTHHPVFRSPGKVASALMLTFPLLLGSAAMADDHEAMDSTASTDSWLPSLITETPQEGFALAVTLSQKGVATT